MPFKDDTETLALWQKMVDIADELQTYLVDTFEAQYLEAKDAIYPDGVDSGFENAIQEQMLETLRGQLSAAYSAAMSLVGSTHYSLGRLAGSPDLSNRAMNLAYFNDYLVANSENIKSRGLTKFTSATPGGGNFGNGVLAIGGEDPQGVELDIAHPQTIRLVCVRDSVSGDNSTFRDNEEFLVTGETPSFTFPWREGGTGIGGEYKYQQFGFGANEFSRAQRLADRFIRAIGGSQQSGNLVRGDFENQFSGTAVNGAEFADGWVAVSGGDKISFHDTSGAIKGDGCIKITGNCEFMYPLDGAFNIASKANMLISAMFRRFVSTSLTGTVAVELLDDSNTHGTLSVSLASLTHDTPTHASPVVFAVPSGVGKNLRLRVVVTSWSDGSAGSSYLLVDEVVLGPTYLLDGGYSVGLVSGLLPFRKDDEFTAETTTTDEGRLQYYANREWGRSLFHDTAATFWSDPA